MLNLVVIHQEMGLTVEWGWGDTANHPHATAEMQMHQTRQCSGIFTAQPAVANNHDPLTLSPLLPTLTRFELDRVWRHWFAAMQLADYIFVLMGSWRGLSNNPYCIDLETNITLISHMTDEYISPHQCPYQRLDTKNTIIILSQPWMLFVSCRPTWQLFLTCSHLCFSLQQVNLSENQLSSLPHALLHLTRILKLSAAKNQLTVLFDLPKSM